MCIINVLKSLATYLPLKGQLTAFSWPLSLTCVGGASSSAPISMAKAVTSRFTGTKALLLLHTLSLPPVLYYLPVETSRSFRVSSLWACMLRQPTAPGQTRGRVQMVYLQLTLVQRRFEMHRSTCIWRFFFFFFFFSKFTVSPP